MDVAPRITVVTGPIVIAKDAKDSATIIKDPA